MNQRNIKNGVSEFDSADTEGGDVSELLRSLPRVDAPGNFEFGVRSRIAVARDSKPRSALVPFLKIAGPLTLMLLIGAFLFYGTIPATDSTSVAVTPPTQPLQQSSSTDVARDTTLPEVAAPLSADAVEPEVVLAKRPTSNTTRFASNVVQRRDTRSSSADMPLGGGSVDQTIRSGRTILPPGFESASPRNVNPVTNSSSADVLVRDVLDILGITADFANGGWSVRSVIENSIAIRSGVQAGDVIEAIDGQPVRSDSRIKGSAKGLTIRRDGKQLNLNLTN